MSYICGGAFCEHIFVLTLTAIITLATPPLVSTASSIALTDPGPLCSGQPATLTCNITGGNLLVWTYDRDRFITIEPVLAPLPDPVVRISDTIAFTVSLLMPTSLHLVSLISFIASERMNGMRLRCDGATATEAVEESVSLLVISLRTYLSVK